VNDVCQSLQMELRGVDSSQDRIGKRE